MGFIWIERYCGECSPELNAQGRFPFEKLVKFYSLDQINQAAKDSENGGTTKPIIRLITGLSGEGNPLEQDGDASARGEEGKR